ncbi:MAG TPA: response regulator [Thermoanaerobaculia bacterium]|nr:response regulator [Thermoanaerobaculia bacterium]
MLRKGTNGRRPLADEVTLSAADERTWRFHVAFHRTRSIVYFLAFPFAMTAIAVGIATAEVRRITLVISIALALAVLFYLFYRFRLDRRIGVDLAPIWMTADVVFITLAVVFSGGMESPWFVWYLTNAAAAAFVAGRRAAFVVTLANTAAYIGALWVTGEITGVDENLYLAFFRMFSIAGASCFLLVGIANAQEKRLLIQQLKDEEREKVDELTRLADELHKRTEELDGANRKIREADRMKSRFLANMSHELRTPMNSIIGFSEILIERLEGKIDPKQIDFLGHILASGQHLLAIINDILDLSKIEAGKVELFPETFPVGPVIENVCNIARGVANKRKIRFELDIPGDLPEIETDQAKFKQILYNLLSNAVKFSPPGSSVVIRARGAGVDREHGGKLAISVIDRGIGIAPEDQQLVFEEFRQVDSSSRREFGGTGLGLALVRKFVELQNGTVSLESAIGEGSCFTVTLPLRFDGATRGADVLETHPAGRTGERVLIVEDDAAAYESISRTLSSAAYIPIRARYGEEAVRLARSLRPVAITLDLVIPGSDGWEVLKQLKSDALTRDIPVLIVTVVDNRELGIALGADDYFLKPLDSGRLIDRLQQLVATSARRPRVLLIDDDRTVREMLAGELQRHGYELISADSGTAGIKSAISEQPDLVVLDLLMPGISGFEVAKILKEMSETSHIPILILTAKDLTAGEKQKLQMQIAALVPKGESTASRLVAAIRQLETRQRERDWAS